MLFPLTPNYQLGLVLSLVVLYHHSSGSEQRDLLTRSSVLPEQHRMSKCMALEWKHHPYAMNYFCHRKKLFSGRILVICE